MALYVLILAIDVSSSTLANIAAFPWMEFWQLIGLMLASYGLLRESFAHLAKERDFGEGRCGEGAYGGGSSALVRGLVMFATMVALLPSDEELTLVDRKRNAALAISGVSILVITGLIQLLGKLSSLWA